MRSGLLRSGLLWCYGAHHLSCLLIRRAFHFSVFGQLLNNTFHHFSTLFDMGHFPSSKHYGYLNLVTMFQKTDRLFDFEVDIMLTRLGPQANFFQLGLMLLAIFLSTLALFVFEFAKVHDPAHRRLGLGCNFDQIKPQFLGFLKSYFRRYDSQLFSIGIDDAYGTDSYLFINPVTFVDCLFLHWDRDLKS